MKKIICLSLLMFAFCFISVSALENEVSKFDIVLEFGEHEANNTAIKTKMLQETNLLTDEMRRNVNFNELILTIDSIEIDKLGVQNVVARLDVEYSDEMLLGIRTIIANIEIDIQDNEAPVIILESDETTVIDLGDRFEPMDIVEEISDNRDDSEDLEVYYEGDFNVNETGSYVVNYVAKDSAGNVSEMTHQFEVEVDQIQYLYYAGGDVAELTNYFYEKGLADLGPDEEITLDQVPLFTQDDDKSMIKSGSGTCGSTIDRYGCALVSFAMVANSYNDDITVDTVNNLGYSSSGCYFDFDSAANYYDLNFTRLNVPYSTRDVYDVLLGMMREDKPAIVGLKSYANGSTHFVVSYSFEKVDGNEAMFVQNPTNGNYDSLNNLSKKYYIYRIYYLTD